MEWKKTKPKDRKFPNCNVQFCRCILDDFLCVSLHNRTGGSPLEMLYFFKFYYYLYGRRLFCLAAVDFYSLLSDRRLKEKFVQTFQAAAEPGTPLAGF
jgi:hypothetical protein